MDHSKSSAAELSSNLDTVLTRAEQRELPTPYSPEFQALVNVSFHTARLGMEKAAANLAAPERHPLARDENSYERHFSRLLRRLPQKQREVAVAKLIHQLDTPPDVRAAMLVDLARVRLTDARSVEAQVRALGQPRPLSGGILATVGALHASGVQTGSSALTATGASGPTSTGAQASSAVGQRVPRQPIRRVDFLLHTVLCNDETSGVLNTELGDDEIGLGAAVIRPDGATQKISSFLVGDGFQDGVSRVFSPPRLLANIPVNPTQEFPQHCFVTLCLAELDYGAFPAWLTEIVNKIRAEVSQTLAQGVGAAIGIAGGPIGVLIGLAVGAALEQLIDWLKSVWEDDVFPLAPCRLVLPSPTFRFFGSRLDSALGSASFVGHGGRYTVQYSWRLRTDTQLIAKHSHKALDIPSFTYLPGTRIQQYAPHAGESQRWTLVPVDADHCLIQGLNGLVLDVANASLAEGAPVNQFPPHFGANQQWRFEPAGGGYYRIRARHSGLVLDIPSASLEDGAPLQQFRAGAGASHQLFRVG